MNHTEFVTIIEFVLVTIPFEYGIVNWSSRQRVKEQAKSKIALGFGPSTCAALSGTALSGDDSLSNFNHNNATRLFETTTNSALREFHFSLNQRFQLQQIMGSRFK